MSTSSVSRLSLAAGLRRYEVAVFGVVALLGGALCLLFRGAGNASAIAVSGSIALVVQPTAVLLARLVPGNVPAARMGLGALLRMFTLVVYAVTVAAFNALPITAALISLAAFSFASTLIEPLVIKP